MRGEMTITITLSDADDGGTDLVAVDDDVPPGVSRVRKSQSQYAELVRSIGAHLNVRRVV